MQPPLQGKVLITGASSGIGRELARQLAPIARALVLVARREDRLQALRAELTARFPKLEVDVLPCDLADHAQREALLQRAGAVDVLINNAGLGDLCFFERADASRLTRMLQVNVLALTQLTHALVPGMVARGRGGVLNLGSGAGFAMMPGSAVYAGTKHFVNGFTESLRLELEGTGVVVTQVCPGPVLTELREASGGEAVTYAGPLTLTAEACARYALTAFQRAKPRAFPGRLYRFLMALHAWLPRWMERRGGRRRALAERRRQLSLLHVQRHAPAAPSAD